LWSGHGVPLHSWLVLTREWLTSLEQRLESAEHEHPAARHRLRRLGSALELVVHERQLRDAAVLRLDLPGDAAHLLGGELGVVEALPLVDEAVRRVLLEDRRVAPELSVGAVRAPPAARHLDL
jgi:hypothetical protein